MTDMPPLDTAGDLATRLRAWLYAHDAAPEVLGDLVLRTATALDQVSRGDEVTDEDSRTARQQSYKEVLATRGERHRPDGTPIWPLRATDFPGSLGHAGATTHARAHAATHGSDLPDWML